MAGYWQNIIHLRQEQMHQNREWFIDMFPYPSGARSARDTQKGYTATDILSRYKRAQGYYVLSPNGMDAWVARRAIRYGYGE